MTPRESLLLAVDGGGTSTVALLGRKDGVPIGAGTAGPSNAKAVGNAAARQALDAAISAAFTSAGLVAGPATVACLGLAGFDRPEDKQLLGEWAETGHWA